MPDWNHWYKRRALASALAMGGAIAFPFDYAWSQIQSDNSLGTQRSIVISPNQINFQSDGGATRDTNLFHSFQEFSVPTGGSVHFNNTANIQNIMMRVTGKSISNIDGLIGANGTANLFLINPNEVGLRHS
ncbi:filamentous hemagglutinin N-terminal domain-containing protein [Floridanema aerugineum]|uniref:Filamentous hemagglutinin N-terminal domain-containing protein n=1 Tax=Floridaenema aerugineum BLCC-F46 TaxID=3153654 RepID=A0ABV4X9M6_9CYAN